MVTSSLSVIFGESVIFSSNGEALRHGFAEARQIP